MVELEKIFNRKLAVRISALFEIRPFTLHHETSDTMQGSIAIEW